MPATRNHFSIVSRLDYVDKIIHDTTFQGEFLSSHANRVSMLLIRSLSRSKSAYFVTTEGKGHEDKKSIYKGGRLLDL
jgi:hypothetical protein